MVQDREAKIRSVLEATIKVLAEKGYDAATIPEISKAAKVSRGILHYYFSNKEDLVTKALASSSSVLVKSSLDSLKGKSPEEIADNVINVHKKNIGENPDFYSFLFEMWCAGRRSKKIKKEFITCQGKVVSAIREWLESAIKEGIIKIHINESESTAKAFLNITVGWAFYLINHPDELNDKRAWTPLRIMILAALRQ